MHHHQDPNWLSFSLSHNPNFYPSSHLSILSDFLTPLFPPPPPPPPPTDDSPAPGICDNASFPRGFPDYVSVSRDHENPHPPQHHQELQLLASEDNHHHQQQQQQVGKKAIDTFGQRTSIYRGVTRHRWTGRYEAHLWDNSCKREGQSRKGRQGGYDKEDKAARAYDLAALKYWGPTTTTNFPVCNYEREIEEMKHISRQEFVASLRRKSSGFSRGASVYRGVTRHHQHGRWQARIGRVAGNKDLYLGTFTTQEEAAEAYDIAAIKFRGLNAVTNFDMSRYDVKSIMSCNLPIGGMSGKSKNSSEASATSDNSRSTDGGGWSDERDHVSSTSSLSFSSHRHNQPLNPSSSTLSFSTPVKVDPSDCWPALGYNRHDPAAPNGPFQCALAVYENRHSNSSDFNGGVIHRQQEQNDDGAAMTYAAAGKPGLTGTGEEVGSRNNWTVMGPPPSEHSFQTGNKRNLGMFHQTPIFGLE
ncbi:hypothetical protein MLD38_014025 [Melastoma candidum]|uniref:Uncharacterized protein n=1 Tax=Melastoma candidum TaxID=119954 RepID=A0ACB9RBE1_9MYRT|nr:hypothetical protein MLD38_014025 [Melastoma candidum]